MGRLAEIQKRKMEIRSELQGGGDVDLDALETELRTLDKEQEEIEKRNRLAAEIRTGNVVVDNVIDNPVAENKEKKESRGVLDTKEYRAAFLKQLQGKKLNIAEERAMTTAKESVGAAVPTITQNLIMEKVEQYAPLLQEIELLRVEGNVTFAVEADQTEANIHVEGAQINEDGDVLIPVVLGSFEITKYITISKSVARMSIDAFETWLTNMLARRIARKIVKLIISGSGINQPTGVEKANNWNENNSVEVPANLNLNEKNITDTVALLPGAYDANAKWLMSKKTLLTDFRPLQDKSKNDLFVKENGTYYVEGYPVMLDDSVTLHEAFLGDFKMYAGNLSEDVTVDTDKKLSSNSFEYLGCAMFDGKPAIGEAFVKIRKATVA